MTRQSQINHSRMTRKHLGIAKDNRQEERMPVVAELLCAILGTLVDNPLRYGGFAPIHVVNRKW